MASRMIDPRAIKELLNENVDENAVNLAILTTHGTLLALSPPSTDTPTQRSLSALLGLTWRRHSASLYTQHASSPDVQHVKTLRLTHPPGSPYQLKGMIAEWEGIVAVVEEVKKGVLVAAQRPSEDFGGERIGRRLVGKAGARGDEDVEEDEEDDEDGDADEDEEEVDGVNGSEQENGEVSKIRRLELRAQGIAEAVAVEWPGPLPEGFY